MNERLSKLFHSSRLFHSDEDVLAFCQKVLANNDLHDWRVKASTRHTKTGHHDRYVGQCSLRAKLIRLTPFNTQMKWAEESYNKSKLKPKLKAFLETQSKVKARLMIRALSEDIKQTIYHEVAHALVPSPHHHSIEWARVAIKLGCTSEWHKTGWEREVLAQAEKELKRRSKRAWTRKSR